MGNKCALFPGQSIIITDLTLEPLCISGRHFEFHFHCPSKECCVRRFVHNSYCIVSHKTELKRIDQKEQHDHDWLYNSRTVLKLQVRYGNGI